MAAVARVRVVQTAAAVGVYHEFTVITLLNRIIL